MSHPYRPKRDSETGEEYLPIPVRGHELLEDRIYNKGTSWPAKERAALGILGLLPPRVSTESEQLTRVYESFRRKASDLDRYIYLQGLHDRNEILFYKLLLEHVDEMMPIVYTPTVGQACREFHQVYRRPRGLYVAAKHVDRTAEMVRNVTKGYRIVVAVVTDGERILGLGDLGANGMGISIGKLTLYVAAGGFHPAETLPIMLDVGTDNVVLREHPLYIGTRQPRLRGDDYERVVETFVKGFTEACPDATLQFEDFKKANALRLLDRFRDRLSMFNDDIQGTGAVTTAAVLASTRATGRTIADERVLLVGAGAAGTGIARALVAAGARRENIYTRDSRGVVTTDRKRLDPIKGEFAADPEELSKRGLSGPDAPLADVVTALAPTVLVGTTGQPQLFGEEVIRAAARHCQRPLVLPLSNPTSNSEAEPHKVTEWSGGRALIATGSPYPPVRYQGEERAIAQCNNVFIFPGVGLGVKLAGAERVTDSMFTAAARALAGHVSDDEIARAQLLPTIARIRDVTVEVAAAVAADAVASGHATDPGEVDWEEQARAAMWTPRYLPYRYEPR